jgi:parvulin-like peptidyl-prolyl isomerase
MIFYGGVSIIVAVILIVLVGWYIGEYRPLHQTVIAIGDTEFDASYYIDALRIVGQESTVDSLQSVADSVVKEIEQNELIRQEALILGISINDDEIKESLKDTDITLNDVTLDFIRGEMLVERLKNEYFEAQVPVSDKQVHIMAMMLESERQAREIRDQLQNSENLTSLAEEFALNYYSKNVNKGDFGWHPEVILKEQLGTSIPVEFAFSAEPESLSEPMHDEETYKQLGYWLINVNDIPQEGSANVSAVFLSSEEEAEGIKSRLEAGEDLATLAEEYSQYSESKQLKGELGLMFQSDNISNAFNGYVFNPEVEIGVWSEPIQDDAYWTQGGYWLVKVIDKDDDRELSVEDRDYLIYKMYDDWVSQIWLKHAAEINHTYLTPEVKQWVIEKATED